MMQPQPDTQPQPVPLRKRSMNLANLAPGSVLHFASGCPLPSFTGGKAVIDAVRTYLFGSDMTVSYQLAVDSCATFQLTIAEDAQGYYLAISRELSAIEQDQCFGRDAIGFFTEASSAKTIRSKPGAPINPAWLAPRYSKTVDWVEGSVVAGRMSTADPARQVRKFHYNLLVDESGEKALEIEHYGSEESKVYLTVYRPAEDIASFSEPVPHIPTPSRTVHTTPAAAKPESEAPVNGHPEPPKPAPRPDFRRIEEDAAAPIHIGRASGNDKPVTTTGEIPPLPSFLLSRETNYLSLDEILTPETERVRCDLASAKILIDTALKRRVHVREIMRDLLGLEAQMADEAVFELPLSEHDYRVLAQRYRLRPDRRADIRACLQEELRLKLLSIAKS